MNLFEYILDRAIDFGIASIPLIVVFIQLKIYKFSIKAIVSCLLLNLLVSVYFWVNLKDLRLTIYQCVPFVLSFLWIYLEKVLRCILRNKRREGQLNDAMRRD